jgi:hypothetical protein
MPVFGFSLCMPSEELAFQQRVTGYDLEIRRAPSGWQVGIYPRSADLTILLSLKEIVFRRARLCWSRVLPPQPIVNLFVNVVRREAIACLNRFFEKLAAAVDLG